MNQQDIKHHLTAWQVKLKGSDGKVTTRENIKRSPAIRHVEKKTCLQEAEFNVNEPNIPLKDFSSALCTFNI